MNKQDQLFTLVQNEHKTYLAEIRTKSVNQIIESAYDIFYREALAMTLLTMTLDDEQLDFLLTLPNPVGFMYNEWLKTDKGVCEMLQDTIRDVICSIQRIRKDVNS